MRVILIINVLLIIEANASTMCPMESAKQSTFHLLLLLSLVQKVSLNLAGDTNFLLISNIILLAKGNIHCRACFFIIY